MREVYLSPDHPEWRVCLKMFCASRCGDGRGSKSAGIEICVATWINPNPNLHIKHCVLYSISAPSPSEQRMGRSLPNGWHSEEWIHSSNIGVGTGC